MSSINHFYGASFIFGASLYPVPFLLGHSEILWCSNRKKVMQVWNNEGVLNDFLFCVNCSFKEVALCYVYSIRHDLYKSLSY